MLIVALVMLPGRAELVLRSACSCSRPSSSAGSSPACARRCPSARDVARGRRAEPAPDAAERVPELERIEREVTLGQATAFDLHFRLRPTLRRIASELLRARRGIDLDGEPRAARRALGDETWELVRADREPPQDRFGRGIELASLRRVVESLEAL